MICTKCYDPFPYNSAEDIEGKTCHACLHPEEKKEEKQVEELLCERCCNTFYSHQGDRFCCISCEFASDEREEYDYDDERIEV